jgi:hypothetical protein
LSVGVTNIKINGEFEPKQGILNQGITKNGVFNNKNN